MIPASAGTIELYLCSSRGDDVSARSFCQEVVVCHTGPPGCDLRPSSLAEMLAAPPYAVGVSPADVGSNIKE